MQRSKKDQPLVGSVTDTGKSGSDESLLSTSGSSATGSKPGPKLRKKKKSFVASKLGCDHCKKHSKIKCDETLPSCNSCKRKRIRCSYLDAPQELLERIQRAHSIAADQSRLQKSVSNNVTPNFGIFKVTTMKVSKSPKKKHFSSTQGSKVATDFASKNLKPLPNYMSEKVVMPLNKFAAGVPMDTSDYKQSEQRSYSIFDDRELNQLKRFRYERCFFQPYLIIAQNEPVLYSSFMSYSYALLKKKDFLLNNKDTGEYLSLENFFSKCYEYSVLYINEKFKEILSLSEQKNLSSEVIEDLGKSVFIIALCSLIHFGSLAFNKRCDYRLAMNFFYHYTETIVLFNKITQSYTTQFATKYMDGFSFIREFGYKDICDVFIPPYKHDFLDELNEDFQSFKKFLVNDKKLLIYHQHVTEFFEFLKFEIFPLKEKEYITRYPADIIYKTQNSWLKLLPGETTCLGECTNFTMVERIFHAYLITITVALDNVFNHCGYLYGLGFFSFARTVNPFQSTIFQELNTDKSELSTQLKAHVNYLIRIISYFYRRANVYFENVHIMQPYPDILNEGYNRFRSREIPRVKEKQIKKFKKTYIKREHFPQLSYSTLLQSADNTVPLFNHYQILFKEYYHPMNTRISSIIHDEHENSKDDPAWEINFGIFEVSEDGLLSFDFNPRVELNEESKASSSSDGQEFLSTLVTDRYVEKFLLELLKDRRIIQNVTYYDADNNPDPRNYHNILAALSKNESISL